ncbi:FAR1 DNA binding domain-containing protein [Artemisia annua]|uniref:FAR1 DNA binding domain-containing protein n=1 Tax=Artemisia annua TaxID=35608 RepID=A0A2U1KXY5_ARTAN|nr:FAR1 DNA binding domain-containing protein [Artemisia annua]
MNLAGITMNPTDSSTKPSPTPDSSTNHHQKTHRNLANTMNLAGINKNVTNTMNLAGITMNPTDSSKNPPDSSTNQSESSTNPSDSSIINDIDENHLIEVDLVTEGDLPEDEDEDATVKEVHDSMKSPRPTLYEHSETPGGSVYWVPHVDERITVPEEGKSYDTIDEAIEMYSNYAEAGGFQIKKAGKKTTKSGIVTLKYLMCNKEGAPRHVNIDTLDAKHSGQQKRQTTIHDLKREEGCEMFVIRDKNPWVYRKINKELEKEQAEEEETKAKREFLDYKNRDINVIPEQYILRRWTRDIIPPELRRKRNRYGEKNVEIERLTNEATSVVDECLFRLGDKVEKMGDFVEKLKKLRTEVEAEVPNHPSIETGDVIGEHYAISKPDKRTVNNPTKVNNKGNITENERNKRRKSEKEKALGVKKKQKKICGFCGVKTNLHTKTTCPDNPNARKKPRPTVS